MALLDLGLLDLELGVGAVDVGLRRSRLSLGRGERDAVVAIVDAGDQITRHDMLIVGDRDFGDEARRLGGDGELARRDEGVVRRFEMGGIVPVDVVARRNREGGGKPSSQSGGPSARPGLGSLVGRFGLQLRRDFRLPGHARRTRVRRRFGCGGATPRRGLWTLEGADTLFR